LALRVDAIETPVSWDSQQVILLDSVWVVYVYLREFVVSAHALVDVSSYWQLTQFYATSTTNTNSLSLFIVQTRKEITKPLQE
jgi:hypothetical protein